jgi:hypothetical protein
MTAQTNSAKMAAGQKLNRWQKLLTAEQARALPPLYSQEGKGLNATAYVKFFAGGLTWFITEFDPEAEIDPSAGLGPQRGLFFGLVISPSNPNGEFGYFAAAELCARQTPSGQPLGGNRFRIIPVVERDLHFTPKPLAAAFADFTGRQHPKAASKPAEPADAAELAAVAEFDAAEPSRPAPAAAPVSSDF